MDPRFPPLLDQHQIDARTRVRANAVPIPFPSLPIGELLLAGIALFLLISA